LSPSAKTAIFFFFSSASDLIFAARADQQQHVMLQDGKRADAGRDLRIGAQYRKIGLSAIELRERAGAVDVGHDLETEPRGAVLEHRGKLGGKTGVKAVGVSDGEDQRFGMPQPGATAPYRRDSEIMSVRQTAVPACGCY
jgi:hypothetical protein